MNLQWTNNVKHFVIFVVSAVVFVAVAVAFDSKIVNLVFPQDISLVIDSHQPPLVLTNNNLKLPIINPTVRIDYELNSPSQIHIVANDLIFGSEGKLVAPSITIFATRVSDGMLDVSGKNAEYDGEAGNHAGTVFIASASVNGTKIDASGGFGQNGSKGWNGRRGRNGKCNLFSGWSRATNGENGDDGKDGGNGGNGGNVILLLGLNKHPYSPLPYVSGGQPGMGGQGGRGGWGGRGCADLGGIQSKTRDGSRGRDGGNGAEGLNGIVVSKKLNFRKVKKMLDDINLSEADKLEAVKEILKGDS